MPDNLRDYLMVKEAAEYLGVSPSTLRNWERAGKIVSYRNPMNRYRLFRKGDLDAILSSLNAQRSRPGGIGRRSREGFRQ